MANSFVYVEPVCCASWLVEFFYIIQSGAERPQGADFFSVCSEVGISKALPLGSAIGLGPLGAIAS